VTPGGVTPAGPTGTADTPAAGPNAGASTPTSEDDPPLPLPELPSRRTLIVALVAVVGLGAGARHSRVANRAVRLLAIQFQRRADADPDADVARAHRRLTTLLARQHRPRRPGETPRAYVESLPIDDPAATNVRRVLELYERSQYGDGVASVEADEAVRRVDRQVRTSTPIVRWFQRD